MYSIESVIVTLLNTLKAELAGAGVDADEPILLAIISHFYQEQSQADVMIHEWHAFSATRDQILH